MKFFDEYLLGSVQIEPNAHQHGAMLPGGEGEARVTHAIGAELGLTAWDNDYNIYSTLHVRDEAAQWFIQEWMRRQGQLRRAPRLRVRLTLDVIEEAEA